MTYKLFVEWPNQEDRVEIGHIYHEFEDAQIDGQEYLEQGATAYDVVPEFE